MNGKEIIHRPTRTAEWAGSALALLLLTGCASSDNQTPAPVVRSEAQYDSSIEGPLAEKLKPAMVAIARNVLAAATAGGTLTRLPSGEFYAAVQQTSGLPFSHTEVDITVTMDSKNGQPDPTEPNYVYMYNGSWSGFSGEIAMADPVGEQYMVDVSAVTHHYAKGWAGYDAKADALYDTSNVAPIEASAVTATADQIASDAQTLSDAFFGIS